MTNTNDNAIDLRLLDDCLSTLLRDVREILHGDWMPNSPEGYLSSLLTNVEYIHNAMLDGHVPTMWREALDANNR